MTKKQELRIKQLEEANRRFNDALCDIKNIQLPNYHYQTLVIRDQIRLVVYKVKDLITDCEDRNTIDM